MGIFTRARDIISANINALLDDAEDPEKLVNMMVREMEDTLVELKASCAGAMAARRRIEREHSDMQARQAVWADKAQLAVDRGRDDLAREALVEKRRYANGATTLEDELTKCDDVLVQYRQEIAQLEDKLKGVREKQRVLVERHTHARNKRRAEQHIRRVDTSEALRRFDLFEGRLDKMEAEGDLVNFGRKRTLEDRFAELEGGEDVDAELARLKGKA